VLLRARRKGVEWEEVDDLKAVAADVDVLYQTRIQKERFLDRLEDYAAARGKYIIDSDLMKILPQTSVVMHPLPRVDEVRVLFLTNYLHMTFHTMGSNCVKGLFACHLRCHGKTSGNTAAAVKR